jgi:hypothetical protein
MMAKTSENIGEKIDQVCRIIERENPDLDGVCTLIIVPMSFAAIIFLT